MFEPMRLVTARFSVFFDRNPGVRRQATLFEDRLRGQYGAPLVVPIPDELDPSVPRLIFTSTHGFSKIIVSQISLVLEVSLSPDWQRDLPRVQQYLVERSGLLDDLLALLSDADARFCGVVLVGRLSTPAGQAPLIQELARRLGITLDEDATIHDLELKKVRVCQEDLYCNLVARNYRLVRRTVEEALPRVPENAIVERGVEIAGDFNDRRAFNERDGYVSSPVVRSRLIPLAFEELAALAVQIRDENGGE